MVKENHEDSDSDSSDEDFCPEKTVGLEESDAISTENEESADDDEHDDDDDGDGEEGKQKRKLPTICKTEGSTTNGSSSRRATRKTEESAGKTTREKDVLEDSEEDENEKSRTDALWADFLSDVVPEKTKEVEKKEAPSTSSTRQKTKRNTDDDTVASSKLINTQTPNAKDKSNSNALLRNGDKLSTVSKLSVTEVVEFAGEEVRVQRTVSGDSVKENKTAPTNTSEAIGRGLLMGLKRPGTSAGGGLGGILNQIGKKKKLSVLEKTQLDWKSYKADQGLEEELKSHNKGKDGYLERQDFLQRTDLRQFEIEKNLRQSARRTQ